MHAVQMILLLVLGCGGLYFVWRDGQTLRAMTETPTSPVSSIRGSGYYEVKGKVTCERPLHAPLSGDPCVYFRHRVEVRVEESYRDTDGEWKTRTKWKVRHDDDEHCGFFVDDGTGKLEVYPKDATFDIAISDRADQRTGDRSWNAEMGSFFGYRTEENQGQRDTVWTLGLGAPVYALGRVETNPGGLCMGKDHAEGKPFVISGKSEEEQVGALQWRVGLAAVASLVGFGGMVVVWRAWL